MGSNELKAIADRQYGYFTAQQAIHSGISDSHHNRYYVKNGLWEKIERGLYRLPGYEDCLEAEFVRFSLWSRNQKDQPQAVVSHHSALFAYGLAETRPEKVQLTVPSGFRKKAPTGCKVYKGELKLSEVEEREGYFLTTAERTLADLEEDLHKSGEYDKILIRAGEKKLIGESRMDSSSVSGMDTKAIANKIMKNHYLDEETGQYRQRALKPVGQGAWNMICRYSIRSRAGFTLVELLVVISIISILASLLLPALSGAIQQASMINCANNLKQMTFVNMQYASDYNEYLPPLNYQGTSFWWSRTIMKYYYTNINFFTGSSSVFIYNGSENNTGREMGRNSIFCCPESVAQTENLISPSYGRSVRLEQPGQNYWFSYISTAKSNRQSKTIFFGDSQLHDYPNYDTGHPYIAAGSTLGSVHFDCKANVSWVDGHVSGHYTEELIANNTWPSTYWDLYP